MWAGHKYSENGECRKEFVCNADGKEGGDRGVDREEGLGENIWDGIYKWDGVRIFKRRGWE